jgi:LTXXQ motif family protein
MRRGTMLVVGLLLASVSMPPPAAEARPLLFKILRGMTSPFGPMMGAKRYSSRRAHHSRRAVAARTRPAAVAAAPAAAAAATGVAAASTSGNARDAGTATTGSAPVQDPSATASAPEARQDEAAVLLPVPAPAQRNAALTAMESEPQARASAPDQDAPAAQPAPVPRAPFRLGTVGPLAWPTAYEDVVGFTLWPKEYVERLRVHGIGDVLATALAPSTSVAARMRANLQQARADGPNSAPIVPTCGSVDLTSSDWPIVQITSTVDLTDAQRDTLDQLKSALSNAVSSIKSNCRNDADLAPVERLRGMQDSLWTVHDAAQLIRAPLAKFYDSLTEEQKQKFAAPEPPKAGGRTMSRSDMTRMCDLPASAEAPMRQIEQGLRPTKAQRARLELLQKKSFEMGQFLMASCLKPVPATPAERLDAAADRVTAVIFAISNVNIALNDFTSELSDEQKTKLNSLVR